MRLWRAGLRVASSLIVTRPSVRLLAGMSLLMCLPLAPTGRPACLPMAGSSRMRPRTHWSRRCRRFQTAPRMLWLHRVTLRRRPMPQRARPRLRSPVRRCLARPGRLGQGLIAQRRRRGPRLRRPIPCLRTWAIPTRPGVARGRPPRPGAAWGIPPRPGVARGIPRRVPARRTLLRRVASVRRVWGRSVVPLRILLRRMASVLVRGRLMAPPRVLPRWVVVRRAVPRWVVARRISRRRMASVRWVLLRSMVARRVSVRRVVARLAALSRLLRIRLPASRPSPSRRRGLPRPANGAASSWSPAPTRTSARP